MKKDGMERMAKYERIEFLILNYSVLILAKITLLKQSIFFAR